MESERELKVEKFIFYDDDCHNLCIFFVLERKSENKRSQASKELTSLPSKTLYLVELLLIE